MRSKIVIIGVGLCASSMRARPAARSRHAGNPQERLHAKGINWATAAFNSYQG